MQHLKCAVNENTRFCLHNNSRKRGAVCAVPLIYVSNKILVISCVYATRSVSMPDVSSISASEFCSIAFSLSITVSFTMSVSISESDKTVVFSNIYSLSYRIFYKSLIIYRQFSFIANI